MRTTIFHERPVLLYFLDLSTFMLEIDQFCGNKRAALINEIVHWALWFNANIKIRIASCVSNIYLLQLIAWGMCLERTFIIQLGKLSILVFFLFSVLCCFRNFYHKQRLAAVFWCCASCITTNDHIDAHLYIYTYIHILFLTAQLSTTYIISYIVLLSISTWQRNGRPFVNSKIRWFIAQ